MKLKYTGPNPEGLVGALPLKEGWSALDHDEPDAEVAKEKLASRMYAEDKPAAKPAKAPSAEEA